VFLWRLPSDNWCLPLWVARLSHRDGKHEGKPEDNGSGLFGGYTGESSGTTGRHAVDPGDADRMVSAGSIRVIALKARCLAFDFHPPHQRDAFSTGLKQMVDLAGIEPATSSLRTMRSPS
jgi:hypothetical protein